MIEARGLVKHYRSALAVDHLSFDVRPGTVTGFLGPNGAGKPATRLWHLKPRAAKPQVRARTCLSVAINDHGSLATTLGRLSGVPGCYTGRYSSDKIECTIESRQAPRVNKCPRMVPSSIIPAASIVRADTSFSGLLAPQIR
jgi:hypothetical protein